MARKIGVAIADWKDTDGLVAALRRELKPFGVVLQSWDIGTDDTVLTVSKRRIPKSNATRVLNEAMESDPDDPNFFEANEVNTEED